MNWNSVDKSIKLCRIQSLRAYKGEDQCAEGGDPGRFHMAMLQSKNWEPAYFPSEEHLKLWPTHLTLSGKSFLVLR